ncbi:hypothetical protein KSF78_0008016 [Schistosoma japonicum]|nr:hypothetical protein KSF78_0008016 [Schistosoma japonicum]
MSMSIHCDVDYCIIEVRSGSKCILLKFYVSINGMSTDNCALNSGLHSVVAFGECQQQLSVQKPAVIYVLHIITLEQLTPVSLLELNSKMNSDD